MYKTTEILTFHFGKGTFNNDRKGEPIRIAPYAIGGKAECCERGFHGSVSPLDALNYADGAMCSVRMLGGHIDIHNDKIAATQCRVVAVFDATKVLYRFAIETCRSLIKPTTAQEVVALVNALEKFVENQITREQLGTAREAARGAAREAAWGAANGTAWEAANGTAWGTARGAAWEVAWGAVRGTAWDVTRGAYGKRLADMLLIEAGLAVAEVAS